MSKDDWNPKSADYSHMQIFWLEQVFQLWKKISFCNNKKRYFYTKTYDINHRKDNLYAFVLFCAFDLYVWFLLLFFSWILLGWKRGIWLALDLKCWVILFVYIQIWIYSSWQVIYQAVSPWLLPDPHLHKQQVILWGVPQSTIIFYLTALWTGCIHAIIKYTLMSSQYI